MIQEAQDIAKATLAACAAFQSLVDAGDATEALEHIYHDSFPTPISGGDAHGRAELTALRPCAIVYTEDNQGFVVRRDAMGMEDCWNATGVIHFVLFRNVPDADKDNPSKVDTDFRTVIGNIVSQMIAVSETAGYLATKQFSVSGPTRTPKKELKDIGDAQLAEIIAAWGPGE